MTASCEKLFHGTGIYCLAAIAQDNALLNGGHWGKPGEPHGPRLSRDFAAAAKFITYNVHWGEGGVLVFDHKALARDYALQDYQDKGYDGIPFPNEFEVAVLTPAVANLDRYLLSIQVDLRVIAHALQRETMQMAIEECGWCWEGEDYAAATSALLALVTHPKLNRLPQLGQPFHGNFPLATSPLPQSKSGAELTL